MTDPTTLLTPALQWGALGLLGLVLLVVFMGVGWAGRKMMDSVLSQAAKVNQLVDENIKANVKVAALLDQLILSLKDHNNGTTDEHKEIQRDLANILGSLKQ